MIQRMLCIHGKPTHVFLQKTPAWRQEVPIVEDSPPASPVCGPSDERFCANRACERTGQRGHSQYLCDRRKHYWHVPQPSLSILTDFTFSSLGPGHTD